ncbi:MAG: hypothetical protein IRZ32_04500 [Solirubrobacteraceae bacterium]|nr:hypothetical protein [Solirubrobacteraceae bacterium]
MSDREVRRVVVVLEPGPGPIRGQIEQPGAPPRPFAGWLELCALLDAARGAGPAEPPPGR